MEKGTEYACWLHNIPGIGNKTIRKLVEYAGGEEAAYRLSQKEAQNILPPGKLSTFCKWQCEKEPAEVYENLINRKIQFVPWFSKQFPEKLREIPDSPYAVYLRGNGTIQGAGKVAVIGARSCSAYGARMAEFIGKELAEAGVVVVSGLARGIDGIGQRAAIKAGGCTVGVLGNGVDVYYPKENGRLYEECMEQGILLSEYAPGTAPKTWHFPARNRIISGLSDLVIVVEAREKSGTFITVDMALEQGREVVVVPGRFTDDLSRGCNRLIGQGAQIFTSMEEVLQYLPVCIKKQNEKGTDKEEKEENSNIEGREELEEKVYTLCDYYPRSLTEIYEELLRDERYRHIKMTQMLRAVVNLQIQGSIIEKGKNYYYRRN
ncbi:MAG: DNA-protecting protein DprA [Clostridiales bacterium]|nr:DNA-protecting protein DprA [Clostridiales bacterium]